MFFNDDIRNYTYDDLRNYISKNYGYILTDDELELVISWFKRNKLTITVSNLQDKISSYLATSFPGRTQYLTEDDSSNLNYLYAMLSSNIKK